MSPLQTNHEAPIMGFCGYLGEEDKATSNAENLEVSKEHDAEEDGGTSSQDQETVTGTTQSESSESSSESDSEER